MYKGGLNSDGIISDLWMVLKELARCTHINKENKYMTIMIHNIIKLFLFQHTRKGIFLMKIKAIQKNKIQNNTL